MTNQNQKKRLLSNTIKEYIKLLMMTDDVFSIIINVDKVSGLSETQMKGPTLFHIAEYSKETFLADEDVFSFHFGDSNNVEHVITGSYGDIGVIVERGAPIINNILFLSDDTLEDIDDSWKSMKDSPEKSYSAFKGNPLNEKLFRKNIDVKSALPRDIDPDGLDPII